MFGSRYAGLGNMSRQFAAVLAFCFWLCPAAVHGQTVATSSIPAFGLTYEQAVAEGMQHNLDLLAAKYNIPMAEADELTAGLRNNPSFTVGVDAMPFSWKNWHQDPAGGPRELDMGFSYPVDLSGKRIAAKRSAHKATSAARATFQDVMRQTLRDIRLAYIDVLTLNSKLDLAKEKESSLQQLLNIIVNRVASSTRLPLLTLRAQLERDQAGLDRRQVEVDLRASQTALAAILGRTDETPIEPVTPLRDFQMPEPPDLNTLVKMAQGNRPDLLALRLSREQAELDRKLAVAQKWDDFDVEAGIALQDHILADPEDPASTPERGAKPSWNAAITVPLPFFNRNQGNIRKAALTGEQIQKQITSLEISMRQEIAGISEQLELNRGSIVKYESSQLANARKVLDEQQKQVGMGSNSLLEYFDAVDAYEEAVSSYYDAVGDYRRNVARLSAACAQDVLP